MRAVTPPANSAQTTWRLTPTWRKTLLVLLLTARTTDDPALVASGFNAIRMIS